MSSEQTSENDDRRARVSLRRKLAVGVVVILFMVVLLHRFLLAGVYGILVSEDAVERVSLVVVFGADRLGLDKAQEVIDEGIADAVLIVERRLPRIAQLGITLKTGDLIRQELVARQVPDSAIDILPTDAVTGWEAVRELDQHLANEEVQVAILCPEHHTRQLCWVIDHTVDPSRADRYRVWSFSPGNFDAGSWWTKRLALVKVAVGYLRLLHAIGFGEGEYDADNWSPDAYEESITKRTESKAA